MTIDSSPDVTRKRWRAASQLRGAYMTSARSVGRRSPFFVNIEMTAVSAATGSSTTTETSMRLHVEIRTASCTLGCACSSASASGMRRSESDRRSRSSTGAVL